MPYRMRCLLYRTVDFKPDSRNAGRQTRRCALCPADGGQPLRDFWTARAACLLFRIASVARDVRHVAGRCDHLDFPSGGRIGPLTAGATRLGAKVVVVEVPVPFVDPDPLLTGLRAQVGIPAAWYRCDLVRARASA